jgi:hypothetical protein
MTSRCCEFVDSRLRDFPADRASAVRCGQARENPVRFPALTHRSRMPTSFTAPPQQHSEHVDLLKNFGIKDELTVLMPGINGKMSELHALAARTDDHSTTSQPYTADRPENSTTIGDTYPGDAKRDLPLRNPLEEVILYRPETEDSG